MTIERNFHQECEPFVKEAEAFQNACGRFFFASSDKALQEDHRDKIPPYVQRCHDLKQRAVGIGDERLANVLLGMIYTFQAIFNELNMWIALKEERSHDAWKALIVAQINVRCTIKANRFATGMEAFSKRLHDLEGLLFPKQVFMSTGHVVDGYSCSICEAEYGTCGHVVGRPYMGELCSRIRGEIKKADHVAVIVDKDPMDKRCRITAVEVNGELRDRLSWKVVPRDSGSSERLDGHILTQCILMVNDAEPGT